MTSRRMLIAGNWKLNKTVPESVELATTLRQLLAQFRHCDLVVAPVYTALYPVAQKLLDCNIAVAGQDLYYEDSGAYTGAVSAPHLRSAGCHYVLVGHSERRQLFGETLQTSHKRVLAALRGGLQPIVCVGETLQEREAGNTTAVVGTQLDAALDGVGRDDLKKVIVAYEPVWAIGTGRVATSQQAQEVHRDLRERLAVRDREAAAAMRILYGGSVKPDNAAELLAQPDIDGALVGGASLDAASFASIVRAAKIDR